MAIYRNVQMTFWTDAKIVEEFTPDDKLIYLYLMTNPHTNLAGCYEITLSQMCVELGFSKEKIEKLIERMEKIHQVIRFSKRTREILILNWSKYNWTSSPKFRKPLLAEIEEVKDAEFKRFLLETEQGLDSVSIPYQQGMDTSDTVTDTDIKPIKSTSKHINYEDLIRESGLPEKVQEMVKMWVEYKTERHDGYKETGFKSLLSQIRKNVDAIGADAVCNSIENSMGNGWVGIHYDKKGNVNRVAQQLDESYQMISTWGNDDNVENWG